MFDEDSKAKSFSLSRTKVSYIVNFGLAPYFKEKLVENINKSGIFSISFDESFNKVLQKTQMDIIVRFMDNNCTVATQYFTSQFLGHCTANDLKNSLLQ